MIKKKTTLFCICFFVVFISLIYLLRGILLPFVMGFVLAYMLNPLVIKLEKHHFSRVWAKFSPARLGSALQGRQTPEETVFVLRSVRRFHAARLCRRLSVAAGIPAAVCGR